MSELINVRLHSKHSKKDENNVYTFDIGRTLSFVHKNVYLTITQFQAIHNIFNVTTRNNEFLGEFIRPGFYQANALLGQLNPIIKNKITPTVIGLAQTETLQYVFTAPTTFAFTGTILKSMGISSGISILEGVQYVLRSDKTVDLNLTHNIHICSDSITIEDHNITDPTQTTLCSFPLNYEFGQFILHVNETRDRARVLNDFINDIRISVKDDDGYDIFTTTDFSLTLQFEVFPIETTPPLSMNMIGGALHPVINRITSILKDVRQLQLERYNEKMKTYLTTHPLYSFTETEIKRIRKKKMNLLEEIKKNKLFL